MMLMVMVMVTVMMATTTSKLLGNKIVTVLKHHAKDRQTEAQRGEAACPGPHSTAETDSGQNRGLRPQLRALSRRPHQQGHRRKAGSLLPRRCVHLPVDGDEAVAALGQEFTSLGRWTLAVFPFLEWWGVSSGKPHGSEAHIRPKAMPMNTLPEAAGAPAQVPPQSSSSFGQHVILHRGWGALHSSLPPTSVSRSVRCTRGWAQSPITSGSGPSSGVHNQNEDLIIA